MQHSSGLEFVGVDWGTTHRRAYALDASGRCIHSHTDGEGAMACKGRFSESLGSLLQVMGAEPRAVLMSGMVGSAMGWKAAPYLDASVALQDLPQHLMTIADSTASAPRQVVPGYCIRNQWGQPDVMRGEETQLLGAVVLGHHSGWFVLPGTHSKWVLLDAGRIVQLRTYMTGELFDLLCKHGTLAAAASGEAQVWDAPLFVQGVQAAQHGALSHLLFECRARVVCGDMSASAAQAYLSGVLIGSEVHDVARDVGGLAGDSTVKIIGSPALARHYEIAATPLELAFEVIPAQDAYLGALAHFQAARNNA
jgi:2-dehydro-3-deoxygalactonokinase